MGRPLGFVGTGLISRGMARFLIRMRHSVLAWKRTGATALEAEQPGSQVASRPSEAVRRADVLISILADPDAVAARGGRLLDAPILGSTNEVENGQLGSIVRGDLRRSLPVVSAVKQVPGACVSAGQTESDVPPRSSTSSGPFGFRFPPGAGE
ncbi:MAG TPA: NAD(P)-binding domain-containing protein [Planctomycetota bacterium]|nr:NAD(P)-binding domain-containing protein [Planctomycetota bacterium]